MFSLHRFGVDLEKSPNFEIVFSIQTFASIFCTCSVTGLDGTLLMMVLHVCGHFKVLRTKLFDMGRGMLEDAEKSSKRNSPNTVMELRAAMSQLIGEHRDMIR